MHILECLTGTRADHTRLDALGASIFGVRADRLAWGRLYMEDADRVQGIDDVTPSTS